MKQSSQQQIEHHTCPESVAEELKLAGGVNRFGEPNFRCVWGFDRIVPITGEWQEFEQVLAKLTDKKTGYSQSRIVTQLKSSVIETRMVPKYMPANSWHLEMWRPPEEYGTPEQWGKAGEEIIGLQTVDTAGPFPARGEYELCYPITHDGSSHGEPIPLVAAVVAEIVRMIVYGRTAFSLAQRRAAIEQELERKEAGFLRTTQDMLKNSLRPFAGETFVVTP